MTSLGTAILLALTTFIGVLGGACDSNPTPHPGQNKGDQADVSIGGGEVTGTELPPDPSDRDDDDLDPSVPGADEGTGAAGENCADADATSSDASDDDNETRMSDDTSAPESDEDCDTTPSPGGSADYGQVEGASTPTPSDSHPRRAH